MTAPTAAPTPSTTAPGDRPDTVLPALAAMREHYMLCRRVRGGTQSFRAHASELLPKFEAEDRKDWLTRIGMTFAYDAMDQTINALVGLAFTNEPELGDDVPPRIRQEWEDVDGEGTHGSVFWQGVFDWAEQDGQCSVFTDHPPAEQKLTLRQEQERGLRAYQVRVTVDQLVSYRTMTHGGAKRLSQLVFWVDVDREDGQFGTKKVRQYRVYRRERGKDGPWVVLFRVWEADDKGTLSITDEGQLAGPTEIPLATVFAGQRIGFLESRPPLEGLAYSNVDHTQVKSDRRFSMHKCSIPIPVFIGRANKSAEGNEQIVMSPSRGIDINQGGDAKILEPQGHALATLREELLDIERRMADQGIAQLQRDNAVQQTATDATLRERPRESKLARAVRSLQDAIERSHGFMAQYYHEAQGGGSVTIRRDFAALTLSDADGTLLTAARERGDLTLETFLKILRLRGRAFEAIEPEQEAEAVRQEMGDDLEDGDLDETLPGRPDPARATTAAS